MKGKAMRRFYFLVAIIVGIYLNAHAEISKYEFNLDPNTPCVLGGNFELIKKLSLKPALFM
jgi:hypothetical protein